MKKLLTVIIAFTFTIQSAGSSYALRPMATRSSTTASSLLAATKDSMGSTSYLIDFNLKEVWKQPAYITGNSIPTTFVDFFIGDELVARSNLTLYDGIAEIYLCRGQFLVTPQYRGRGIGREIAARTFLKAKELASSLNIELKCAIAYFEWSIDDELRWEGQQGRIMEHAARVFEGLGFRKSLADDTLASLPGRKNFGGYWARDFDDFCGECEEKLASKSSSAGNTIAIGIGRGEVMTEDTERRVSLSSKQPIEELVPGIATAVNQFFYDPNSISQLISKLLHDGASIADVSNIIYSITGIAFGSGFTVQNRSVVTELTSRFYVLNNKGLAKDRNNYCFGASMDQEVFVFRDLIMKILEAKERNRFSDDDIKRAIIALWVNASMLLQQSTKGEVLTMFLAAIDKADVLGILMAELAVEYTEEPEEALNQEIDARFNTIEPGYIFTPVLGSLCNLTSPVLAQLGITNERALIIGRKWLGQSLLHWLADDARLIMEGTTNADFDPSFLYQLEEGSERLIISANVYSLFDDWRQPLKAVYDSLEDGGVAVFIQNNVPHPRSIQAELEAKGYVYIPEIDAFFPNRAAANQVLAALAKCNRKYPSYGTSEPFMEYDRLRGQLAINAEAEFHEIMLNRLGSVGFKILKEGSILSRHIGRRQRRHQAVITNAGLMEIPSGANVMRLESGNMKFLEEDELPQGYILETSSAHIIVACKQKGAQASVLPRITTEADEQVEFLDGTRPCEFLYNEWFTRLPEGTQAKVKKALSTAFNELAAGIDYDRQVGRSLIIDLPKGGAEEIIPATIHGKTVRAVKVKGATLKANQEISRYKNNPTVSVDFDKLGRAVNNSELTTPTEAMGEERALSAYHLHKISMQSPVNMDVALGRGRFYGKSFENKGVWAIALGIEYEENHRRFFDHLAELMGYAVAFKAPWTRDITGGLDASKISANLPEIRAMFTELGAEIRTLHEGRQGEEGIIYVTPYLGQISWMDGKIKIHDMEDSKHQAGMSLDQKIAYRLQDLRTLLLTLNQLPELTAIVRRLESIGANPSTLILDGYFRDEIRESDALRGYTHRMASEEYRENVMHKFYSRTSRNSEELILLMERIITEKERGGPTAQLLLKTSSAGEDMYKRFASIAGTTLGYRLSPSNSTFPSTITGDEMSRIERGITRFYTEEYARNESFHQFWWDRIRDSLYYYAYTTTGAYTTDLSGKDIIFSNNFVGCNALIFKGKKGNKPVTGLLHFVTDNLTNGTIFDCLQKEGIVEPVFVVTFMPTTMGLISLDRMSQQALTLYPDAKLYAFPRYPIRDLDVAVSSEGFGIFAARKGSKAIMPGRAFLWKEIEDISEKQTYLGCLMSFEYRADLPVLLEGGSELFLTKPKDSALDRRAQMALRDTAQTSATVLNELAPAVLLATDSAA